MSIVKKKIIITSYIILAILLVASLTAVIVLALNVQSFNSSIRVQYNVTQGIQGTAKASYRIGNGQEIDMTNSSGQTTIDLESSNLSLQPNGDIELTKDNLFVIFKYTFANTNVFDYYCKPVYQDNDNDDTNIKFTYSNDGVNFVEDYSHLQVLEQSEGTIYIRLSVANKQQNAICTGTINWLISLFQFDKPFADAEWEAIDYIAQQNLAKEYYAVGDEKDVTLTDGETLTFVILGFNHDDLSDGTGKAKISIGMKHLTAQPLIDTQNDNTGGWTESNARKITMVDYYNKIPSDLQKIIKSVNKVSTTGKRVNTNSVTSQDKLWLFSASEIFSENELRAFCSDNSITDMVKIYVTVHEGARYEYFTNLVSDTAYNTSIPALVRKLANGTGNVKGWWLRSTAPQSDYYYFYVSGCLYEAYSSSLEYGIAFGFCI